MHPILTQPLDRQIDRCWIDWTDARYRWWIEFLSINSWMEKYQNDHKIGFQESALSMSLWSSSRCGTSFCSWGRFPNFLWISSHSVVSPGHIAMATCWNSQLEEPSDLNRNLEPEASIIPQTRNLAKKLGKKAQSLLDTWLDSLQIEGINTYRASSWANYSNLLECTIGCMKLCSNHSPKNAETVIQVNSLTVQDTTNFRAASFCNFFRYIIGFLDRPWSMDWWRQQPQQRRWQQDPGL